MTHTLQDRTESEVLWYRRRSLLQAATAWVSLGGFAAAHAQQRSNVVELQGDALLNGQRLRPDQQIQTGDTVQTGPGSHLIFVLGNAAFMVRQASHMTVERGMTLNTVSVLRLITGAIGAVWGKGSRRQVVTPTLTAGIRGTGTYIEVHPEQDDRTYFCNCYGTIAIDAGPGTDRMLSQSVYHQSFWGEPAPRNGRWLTPAGAINHTDEEIEFLAGLAGERTAWQVAGRKGVHDGHGYMEPAPHPLDKPGTR
jgi:hypothetical protein